MMNLTDMNGVDFGIDQDELPKEPWETIEPLGDAVLIWRFEPESKTKGGLLLPDQAQRVQPRGKVLAVGPGRMLETGKRNPIPLVPGDIVVLGGPVANIHMNGNEKNYFIVDVDSIYGVVKSVRGGAK